MDYKINIPLSFWFGRSTELAIFGATLNYGSIYIGKKKFIKKKKKLIKSY